MTYSIVARNGETGELGVAVASHAFAVGRAVAFAAPGVGAVATQGSPGIGEAERLLESLSRGESAEAALSALVAENGGALLQQTALIGATGPAAAHTGALCVRFAGHTIGDDVACQGNLLAVDGTWERMREAYEHAEGPWGHRLLAALEAGLAAGGDLRGEQSAALLVVGPEPGSRPRVDVRVDDHPHPLDEIRRLLALDRADDLLRRGIRAVTGAAGEIDEAREALAQAQELFGADNREPDFWAGLLAEGLGEGTGRYPTGEPWQELRRRILGRTAPGAAGEETA